MTENEPHHHQTLKNLSVCYRHERDENIQFEEASHRYTIKTDPDSKYTSVTTWVHELFAPFDADAIIDRMMKSKKWPQSPYFGKTKEEIKQQWADGTQSTLGTNLHKLIEDFMNQPLQSPTFPFLPTFPSLTYHPNPITHQTLLQHSDQFHQHHNDPLLQEIEWQYFLQFVQSTPHWKPYRSEWIVYQEDWKISGTIDMVYENEDGTLTIYDWKRCKDIHKFQNATSIHPLLSHIPDSNYWHYALQLNMYKAILETKYEKQVTRICLVKLHPNNKSKTFEIIPLPFLPEIYDIMQQRMMDLHLLPIAPSLSDP